MPDLWRYTRAELDLIAAANPPDETFLKHVIRNAASKARLWKANVLINRSNEIMVLDPKKTGTFGTKGVDLADLVFIRSLAPLHPFSPRNKTAAFQACLTKLQVYLSLYHHSLHF